jgi:hypothetical protein
MALRMVVLGASPTRWLGLLLWTGLAATLKDSTLFLLPVHAIVLAVTLLRRGENRQRPRYAMAVAGASFAAILALAAMTRTTYQVGPGLTGAVESPMTFAAAVAADAITQVPTLLWSAWTSLGGFGAMSAPMPGTALSLVLIVTGVAACGLLQIAAAPPTALFRVGWYFVLAVTACLLQAPVRQVLLETADLHQGRWLFPVTVPVAITGAMGLQRALGRYADGAWPLVAIAAAMVMALPWLAVTQWHATGPAWSLDRTHLFLFSTGGLDIDPRRVESILSSAWPAARTTVMALAATAAACLVMLLGLRPVSESLTHVRHADHR